MRLVARDVIEIADLDRYHVGMKWTAFILCALVCCDQAKQAPAPAAAIDREPERIEVQHILISFQGKLPGKQVERTKEAAEQLAKELFERAKKGEDFAELVKKYTDDSAPGIYKMSNKGIKPQEGEYPREGMVPAFGDVGFPLKVGEFGLSTFDPKKSPHGWHIIKRIK